ncbi:MAG: peptidoglycan bridge formation glycyltransferase FemA/FemB family protein [Anaerolineae bacterium]|nr:peptidoglycan bridge formation glycyltransferase FemA/FemB family protein [Candidatus Roseilinea sp.]MDW8449465.1 peptidoglycan bridge formation glycyltransferase FemA/FemB family protein [Anaerolineae bacterium]
MRSRQVPPRARPREISESEWDSFVSHHPHGHILQTQAWGKLKAAHGWRAARASVFGDQNRPVGVALTLIRTLPYGLGKIAYVPRGPVVNWDNETHVEAAVYTIYRLARNHGAFAAVIEPDLLDTPSDRHLLERLKLQPVDFHVQPRRTIWVNLDVDEDVDILAAMKPKTRYNIGLAKRRGVTVRTGSVDDAGLFYAMMRTTAERDAFAIHPLSYYRDFLDLFTRGADAPARLLIAEYRHEPLAALIVTALGERAIYLYGASANSHRELMPTYLLQWEAMLWARRRGCKTYDMWGVPDEDEATLEANFEKRNDGLWGVYRFKRGFGGQVVRHIGAWVYVLSPLRWWLFNRARALRKSTGLNA